MMAKLVVAFPTATRPYLPHEAPANESPSSSATDVKDTSETLANGYIAPLNAASTRDEIMPTMATVSSDL